MSEQVAVIDPVRRVSVGPIDPPLKWVGGKRWQLPHLAELWAPHRHRRLVEPFCGGLSVALGLAPGRALLNDINVHVVNFYAQIRAGLVVTVPMSNDSAAYYAARDRFNALIRIGQERTPEAAQWFYYLNRTGYNGLCRFNSKGLYNVPFGKHATINYRTDFLDFVPVLERWQFTNTDFAAVPLLPGDFIYADPPYDVEFTTYSAGGFGWVDQERTARWLAQHHGPVVLSNQATDRIVRLYTELGYELTFLSAPRRVSCTGDRTPAREVLATKGF